MGKIGLLQQPGNNIGIISLLNKEKSDLFWVFPEMFKYVILITDALNSLKIMGKEGIV